MGESIMSTYERDPDTGNLNLIDGMRSLDDIKALMLDLCYPIGSIYISTKNVSPESFLGGTWKSKSDYVLRGATSDVKFDNDTNDGGADSQSISSVASHNHTQNSHNHDQDGHQHFMIGNTSSSDHNYASPNRYMAAACWDGNNNNQYYLSLTSVGAGAGLTSNTTANIKAKTATNIAKGSNYTVNTLPKYKNVYIWERTA